MSFGMISTEVQHRMREVRRQAARGRAPQPGRPASATGSPRAHAPAMTARRPARRPRLRSRIGFTLVETGLRLLTSGPQAHG